MSLVLALDAMSGDRGTSMVIEGISIALRSFSGKNIKPPHFLLFGDTVEITAHLNAFPEIKPHVTIRHADQVVSSSMKPSSAVRSARRSSMGLAIDSVASGEANAVLSAGNTGAYMALSKIILKAFKGINRPAIPAILPTVKGKTVVLDLGANIDCTAENLVQFALMGEVFARQLLHLPHPSVGLLNVGSEELKGNAIVQEAAQQLRLLPGINFKGFVEGDDIAAGTTDVVVTDGFSGNIALKSIEGAARLIRHFLTEALSSSWRGKLGYLIAKPAFKQIQRRSDPRHYNGAVFLGLKGIAVKSHGGTDAVGFANAIEVATDMASHNFIQEIQERLSLNLPMTAEV